MRKNGLTEGRLSGHMRGGVPWEDEGRKGGDMRGEWNEGKEMLYT